MSDRIEKLISAMSPEEKICQLVMVGGSVYWDMTAESLDALLSKGGVGSVMFMDPKINNELQRKNMELSRHKIPILFCGDVIHGISTIFPIPLAESCSWNPQLAEMTAAAAAREAAAKGCRWTFAPMCDLTRDARWGRVAEGAGEDPLLGALFAEARVRGFQGEGETIDENHVAACVKHFAGYGFSEGGRDYDRVLIGEEEFAEFALPPYRAGINAGAAGVMTSFNDINGVPATVNKKLLVDTLRGEMGFDGALVSDYAAIAETVNHGYASDGRDAALCAISCGVDIDMEGHLYEKELSSLVASGALDISEIDAAVRRVLALKERVGLFDNPYTDETRENRELLLPSTRALALQSALESAVLLKNDGILPLKKSASILLVGSRRDDKESMNGCWSYQFEAASNISILDGLINAKAKAVAGNIDRDAAYCDIIVVAAGFENDMSGEAASLVDIELSKEDRELVAKAKETGKPVVLLVIAGRPIALTDEDRACNGIVMLWHLGCEAGNAAAALLFGEKDFVGRLTMSFPRASGQCPVYYNRPSSGRPETDERYTNKYIDCSAEPLYPFGHGLCYSKAEITELSLSNNPVRHGDTLTATVSLYNGGEREATETVQLYIKANHSKPKRPVKELCDFRRVTVPPMATVSIDFTLDTKKFALSERGEGEYTVFAGRSSAENISRSLSVSW